MHSQPPRRRMVLWGDSRATASHDCPGCRGLAASARQRRCRHVASLVWITCLKSVLLMYLSCSHDISVQLDLLKSAPPSACTPVSNEQPSPLQGGQPRKPLLCAYPAGSGNGGSGSLQFPALPLVRHRSRLPDVQRQAAPLSSPAQVTRQPDWDLFG